MRYEDASGSISSQDTGVTDARDDADALPAGSRGPATGNTITGEGTITGAAGADVVDNGPGKIVALEGASGSDTAEGGSLHVEGRFGEITMDSRGGYSYTPHAAKPEGGSDVFRYTLADADGTRDTATLTIDIGREIEKIDANAQQLVPGPDGVITLPPGVELSDIMVVGRNLVINLPDGTQMVIIDGAVFVPQLVINGVEVPATNLASLLIDAEPQPAAGTPTSSGGNFAVDVPPLDPGVPLGDLIPPTELVFEPPIFEDIGQIEDDEPEAGAVIVQLDDDAKAGGIAGGTGDDPDSVNPTGFLPGSGGDGDLIFDLLNSGAPAGFTYVDGPNGSILVQQVQDAVTVTVLTITVDADTGAYTVVQNAAIRHPSGDNENNVSFVVNYTVTDEDGDAAIGTVTINVDDDTPSVSVTAGSDANVILTTHDALTIGAGSESVSTTANFSGVFSGTTVLPGADGAGSGTVSGYALSTTGGASGLTQGGVAINLYNVGGVIVGSTATSSGAITAANTVFTVSVSATGVVTLTQLSQIDHTNADPTPSEAPFDDHSISLSDGSITLTRSETIVDRDGDSVTGSASVGIGANLRFLDDGPTISVADVGEPSLTVDETDLTANATASFAANFSAAFGADGPAATGSITYALGISAPGANSGLVDVATGQPIVLVLNGGVVEGHVGTAAGALAFTVTVDAAGNVTLDQIRALSHPDATNPDDSVTLSADNLITLTATAHDFDGDTDSLTLNIGQNLNFEDDGPTVTATLLTGTVDEDGVPGGIAGGVGDVAGENTVATGSVAALFNSGADQPLTFSLLANTSGLPALTSAGVAVTYSVVGNTLTASAGGNTVFTFVLNADGSYTFTLVDQLDHPAGNNENDLAIQLGSIIEATDADGDSVTAPANGLTITVDDDTPTASTTLLTGTVDEDGVPAGIAGGVGDVPGENTVASGSVATLFNSGADQPLTFSLLTDTSGLPALTSAGVPVTYSVVGNTLTASAGGNTVFTFVLNADGTYTFTLVDQLDHPAGNNENDLAISLGSIIQATDRDGDPVTANANGLVITVDDDTPQNNAATVQFFADEDALPGGNPGGPEDGPGVVAGPITSSISGLFSSGADQPLTISMSTDTSGLPALTSAGVAVTYSVVGNTLTASAGGNPVFTLVLNPATGEATFTLLDQLDHPTQNGTPDDNTENNLILDVSSIFVGTDADGDPVTLDAGSFTIDVDDDTPTIVAQAALTGTVDEDGLADGNAGGVNDVTGEDVVASGNVSALFSPGADQPLTYSLLPDTSGLPPLTSNGVPVTYSVVGNTLTGSAGGTPVFTFTLNATTGAYEFTLLDQLDHPSLDGLAGDDTENPEGTDIEIALGSIIQATDADGDSVTAPARGLVITVDDDSPEEFEEEDCPEINAVNSPGESQPVTINLPPVGADEPGTVTFDVEDGTAVTDREGNPVTSNGDPLFYFVNDDGVLEARVGDENGDVIFTLTLSEDGTTVTYDQFGPLGEGGGTTFNDLTSTSGGNAEFRGIGANDPATVVDILLSAEAAGADATVNTDSDSIGSANQSMDNGETVRIDFVSDLTSPAATPSGFTYSGHVSSNSFIEVIPQVQGSQDQTVAFTVWALDTTNTSATEPDRNPAGGFSDSTVTAITEVTVTDYLTGDSTTVDVTGFTTGVFTAVAYDISVRVNTDGSVTFAGIQQGDSYGFSTGTDEFNAIAVQAEPAGTGGSTEDSFDLGVFSIGTETEVEPIELAVPIALTDADGDSVVCDIHINLDPPVDAPDISVTVNEAGLPVIGSNEGSNSEAQSGDLQTLVTGGTGPYTFTLLGSGDGAFGTLVLNSNGTFTYTLDTPVDSQPSANDGTNPELDAESFEFEAEDVDGNTQTGTITVNIIDDVPSIDVTTDPEAGVVLLTQDAETIGEGVSDTAQSTADFSDVFELAFVAGADGAAATPALNYTLGISAPAVSSGLQQGGADIFLHLIGGKVVGSTSATTVTAANTVFDVAVNTSGVVTLTQYSQIDHPLQAGLNDTPFADQIISMADSLVTLTATSTITDNDGDTDVDSATIHIGANLQFADHGPTAVPDVDAIAAGFFGTATGNVMTGTEVAVAEDTNGSDGSADNVGADTPGRISQVSFQSDFGGAPVVQTITAGGSTVINGDYGVLTLFSNGDYSYDRNEGSAGGVNDVFTYTLRDFDGDTVTSTLTINIAVNPPVATSDTATVDDDGLVGSPNGVLEAGNGDINANVGETPSTNTGEHIYNGTLNVTGGDGDIDFSLIAPGTGIDVGQETVSITGTSTLLTATITSSPDATRENTTLFTVSLDAESGNYVVTLANNILHDTDNAEDEDTTEVSVNIPYQVLDASLNDSDSNGTLTIQFNDDTPRATAALVSGSVDEDDVVEGADDGGPGDGITGGTGDLVLTPPENVTTGSVTTLFNAGADAPLTYGLSSVTSGLPALTSGGVTVTYSVVGNTLTASAGGGNTVFTFQVLANGNYTFTLLDQLDHPTLNTLTGDNTENELTIQLGSIIQATDADGDTVAAVADADSGLIITVDDDTPTLGTIQPGTANNLPGSATTVGTLNFEIGADETATQAGAVSNITVNLNGATSGLRPIVTQYSNGVLTAYQDVGPAGYDAGDTTVVFTLTVNPYAGTSGQYVFDLVTPLDPEITPVLIGGSSSFGAGPTLGQILEDAGGVDLSVISGYLSTASFDFAAWQAGTALNQTTVNPEGVNGSTAGWGVPNNNFDNTNEIMFFDFGDEALADPDGTDAFAPPATSLPQISFATFEFINYTSGAGNAGDDIAYVVHYVTAAGAPAGSASGFIPAANIDGALWTITAPAGSFIADVSFYSGIEPDGTTVQDLGPGKIDLVSVGVQSTDIDRDLDFTVTLTDNDGDQVQGTFTVNVDQDNSPSVAAQSGLVIKTVADTSDTSSASLMSSDSIDTQRTMSAANNNSVLLGAIAAAGLGVSSAAAAQGFGPNGHQALDSLSLNQDGAKASGFAIQAREVARDGLAGDTQESLRSEDNAASSTVQREIVDKGSLTDDGGDQAQAPTSLLQGTELQASDVAQSTVTSASVGMPSAEMLVGGNSNADAVAGQAQGTAEVGRVLLDALAGGGRGPDLDAVIDAVANQGQSGAAAALDALASLAAADVSAWHMAGLGGFPGGHAGAMEPMLHHDAAVVVS